MSAVIDLFAGPGGWDTGVRDLGLAPYGIERDSAACATARAAGHHRLQADIAELDPRETAEQWGPVRGLIASPPCQGFSTAGNGKGRVDAALLLEAIPHMLRRDVRPELHDRMTDDKSVLALEPLRWALALTPSWLVWEQVPAVLPIWEASAAVLRAVGYTVATGLLSSEQFGVPQTRKRAILVARAPWATKMLGPARLPEPTHSRYYPRSPEKVDVGLPRWVSMADALGWSTEGKLRSNYGTGGDPSARGERLLNQPAPTVTSKVDRNKWVMCSAGRTAPQTAGQIPRNPSVSPSATITGKGTAAWVSDAESVRVSVAEAALFQSFPVDYPWQGNKGTQYRQVGDAVPPLLARAVVAEVAGLSVAIESEVAA